MPGTAREPSAFLRAPTATCQHFCFSTRGSHVSSHILLGFLATAFPNPQRNRPQAQYVISSLSRGKEDGHCKSSTLESGQSIFQLLIATHSPNYLQAAIIISQARTPNESVIALGYLEQKRKAISKHAIGLPLCYLQTAPKTAVKLPSRGQRAFCRKSSEARPKRSHAAP